MPGFFRARKATGCSPTGSHSQKSVRYAPCCVKCLKIRLATHSTELILQNWLSDGIKLDWKLTCAQKKPNWLREIQVISLLDQIYTVYRWPAGNFSEILKNFWEILRNCASEYSHFWWSVPASASTGWRRLIGSPKLQIIFQKRATKYKLLLRKLTYKDKGSYESSPPCIHQTNLEWQRCIRRLIHRNEK